MSWAVLRPPLPAGRYTNNLGECANVFIIMIVTFIAKRGIDEKLPAPMLVFKAGLPAAVWCSWLSLWLDIAQTVLGR